MAGMIPSPVCSFQIKMNTYTCKLLEIACVLCLIAFKQFFAYNAEFTASYICDNSAPANQISYHGNTPSDIFCGALCAREDICDSFLFVNENSTCILNDGLAKDNQTCGHGIMYGAKVVKSCTESFGNVRLCNGSRTGAAGSAMGRVEVFYDGQWGSVCDDGWGDDDYYYEEMNDYEFVNANAKVVCDMFGFTDGVANTSEAFGPGTGQIHLDDVICKGTEASIMDCLHNPIGEHNCDHGEDVGVVCF